MLFCFVNNDGISLWINMMPKIFTIPHLKVQLSLVQSTTYEHFGHPSKSFTLHVPYVVKRLAMAWLASSKFMRFSPVRSVSTKYQKPWICIRTLLHSFEKSVGCMKKRSCHHIYSILCCSVYGVYIGKCKANSMTNKRNVNCWGSLFYLPSFPLDMFAV